MELRTELLAQPDVVKLDLTVGSREAALRALHGELSGLPAVIDAGQFLRDVLERVMVASVCIAPDVALPHARTAAVNRIVLGVARLSAPGIGFDGEHPNVRLVFLIGTPKQEVNSYLQLVGGISRLLKQPAAHEGLLTAKTEAEFRLLLAGGART